jgi:hypothetical protein
MLRFVRLLVGQRMGKTLLALFTTALDGGILYDVTVDWDERSDFVTNSMCQ